MTIWTAFQLWLICVLAFIVGILCLTKHPEWFDDSTPHATATLAELHGNMVRLAQPSYNSHYRY